MAQRKAQRQKAPPRAKAVAGGAARVEPQGIDGWRKECERLRAELQAARDEIAAQRQRQEQVLNRIDWVLDSLDSLGENET